MDLTSLMLFCFISLVIGGVLMLIAQYYVYVRFCNLPEETEEQKDINDKYSLPDVRLPDYTLYKSDEEAKLNYVLFAGCSSKCKKCG